MATRRRPPPPPPPPPPDQDPSIHLVFGPPSHHNHHQTPHQPHQNTPLNRHSSSRRRTSHPLPNWSSPPVSLVWYRGHDLRVQDHPGLDAAVATGGPVVALYILELGAENDGNVIYPRDRHTLFRQSTTGGDDHGNGNAYVSPASTLSSDHTSSSFVPSYPPPHMPSQPPLTTPSPPPPPSQISSPPSSPPSPPPSSSSTSTSSSTSSRREGTTSTVREPPHAPTLGPLSATGDFALGRVPRWYLHHSLHALRNSLANLGITLVIRRVDEPTHTVDQVVAVASALNAGAVFWNKRYKPNAYPVDNAVRTRLSERNVYVADFDAETLMTPTVSSCGMFNDFQSYTRFCINSFRDCPPERPRNAPMPCNVRPMPVNSVCQLLAEHEADFLRYSPMPAALHTVLPDVDDLDLLHGLDVYGENSPGDVSTIGCTAAMKTLRRFLAQDRFCRFAHGDARRDGMVMGDRLATSRISPHVRFGEISPRVVFYAVLDAGARAKRVGDEGGLRAARTFLKNMSLREFGYYMLARYPQASRKPIVPEFEVFPWLRDEDGVMQSAWKSGTTGFPIIDAAMRQLWKEGWLHNKMRFLVASFFVKYLMLPWPAGAAHLVSTLVDGDEACNSLGWQWTAGCNSDSFPFSNLVNPSSFHAHTRSVYQAAHYVRKYVPEIAHLPDRLLFTPWRASAEDCMRYRIAMVPVREYRALVDKGVVVGGGMCQSDVVLYPTRIVDVRHARERSRRAMDVMRKIFSAQRVSRVIIGEQDGCDSSSATYMYDQSSGVAHSVHRRTVTDKDGSVISELDLTGCDCDTASELSTSNASSQSTQSGLRARKRQPNVEDVAVAKERYKKRPKKGSGVQTAAVHPPPVVDEGAQSQAQEHAGDLMALCEVAGMRSAIASVSNEGDSTRSRIEATGKRHQGWSSTMATEQQGTTGSGGAWEACTTATGGRSTTKKNAKRPRQGARRRSSSDGGLPLHFILSANPSSESEEESALPAQAPNNACSRVPSAVPSRGGLSGLAHTALGPQGAHVPNDTGSNAPPVAPLRAPPQFPTDHPTATNVNNFTNDGGTATGGVPFAQMPSPCTLPSASTIVANGAFPPPPPPPAQPQPQPQPQPPPPHPPQQQQQQHRDTPLNSNVIDTASTVNAAAAAANRARENVMANVGARSVSAPFNMQQNSAAAFSAAAAAAAGLYHGAIGAMPMMQGVQNAYSPIPHPPPHPPPPHAHPGHAQHLLVPFRHASDPMGMAHLATPLQHMHGGVRAQGYFNARPNLNAPPAPGPSSHPGHAVLWYPTMQQYVDIRTGLSTGAVLPHVMPTVQPAAAAAAAAMAVGYSGGAVTPAAPYDGTAHGAAGVPAVAQGTGALVVRKGPSTPLEREAIARRMAAMDYHDEMYGGKHWEQWQAISLHLLNCYEFCEDTDRDTSKAYVRLCVLKDELRDANPNGPRVTVNHCKEVFKILQLPVTGEWDRRGHGGVRGPYVYGCSKRGSNSAAGVSSAQRGSHHR